MTVTAISNSLNYSVSSLAASRTSASASAGVIPTMTVAQAVAAVNGGSSPASIRVRDTTVNIQAGLDDLARMADLGKLSDVVFSARGGKLSMGKDHLENSALLDAVSEANITTTATSVTVDASNAALLWKKGLTRLSYDVVDSADRLQGAMSQLFTMHNANKLTSVTASAESTSPLVLSAVQAVNGGFRGKLVAAGASGVEVLDSARNFDANKGALAQAKSAGDLSKIQVVDSAQGVSAMLQKWSTSDLGTYAPVVDSLTVRGPGVLTLKAEQVIDQNLMDALQAGGSKPRIQVTASAGELINNQTQIELAKDVYGLDNGFSVTVRDSKANVFSTSSNAVALERLAQRGLLTGVQLTDTNKSVTASMNELNSRSGLYTALVAGGGGVKLSDTAANITANLDDVKELVAAKVITARSGGIVVTDDKSLAFTADQYSRYADVRNLLRTASGGAVRSSDIVDLKLGNLNNVVSNYRADLKSITTGAGDDAVYASGRKNMLLDLGEGTDDVVYLQGKKQDWEITLGAAADYLAYAAGTSQTNPLTQAFNNTVADTTLQTDYAENNLTATEPVDNKTAAYQFKHKSSGSIVTVLGAERMGFYEAGFVPRGTVNLLV